MTMPNPTPEALVAKCPVEHRGMRYARMPKDMRCHACGAALAASMTDTTCCDPVTGVRASFPILHRRHTLAATYEPAESALASREPAGDCPDCTNSQQCAACSIGEWKTLQQPKAAPGAVEVVLEGTTETFVQEVPNKCDRIIWRGHYYHLPILASQSVAVDLEQFRRAVEVYRGCYDYDRDGRKYKLAEREAEADRLLALIDSAGTTESKP